MPLGLKIVDVTTLPLLKLVELIKFPFCTDGRTDCSLEVGLGVGLIVSFGVGFGVGLAVVCGCGWG